MNSSSLARSAASSFDNPAASYCSGVIAFWTPGKAGFSGSAAGSEPRETRRRQRTKEMLFIDASLLLDLFRGPMSKAKEHTGCRAVAAALCRRVRRKNAPTERGGYSYSAGLFEIVDLD